MPGERSDSSAGVVGNKIYVVGGTDDDGNVLATTIVFDTSTQQWEPSSIAVPDMKTARYSLSVVIVDHFVLAIGGRNKSNGALSTIEVLDTQRNSWNDAPAPMQHGQGGLVAGFLKETNEIIIGGGWDNANKTLKMVDSISFQKGLLPFFYVTDKKDVLVIVELNGLALSGIHPDFQRNREVVLMAVKSNGLALEYAPTEFQNDRDIVLAAIESTSLALLYAHDDLKKDRDVVKIAVEQQGHVFGTISDDSDSTIVEDTHKILDCVPDSILCHEDFVNILKSDVGAVVIHLWVDDKTMAERLYKLVEFDRTVADIKKKDGRHAIDRAMPECMEAMKKALYLFGKFDVDEKRPLLHTSNTACVFEGIIHGKNEKGGNIYTSFALKCMGDSKQLLAEIDGRQRLSKNHVVALTEVYVDTTIDEKEYVELQTAIKNVDDVKVQRQNLTKHIDNIRSRKMNEENIKKGIYKYVLVLEFGERSLDAALDQDRIFGGTDAAKLIMKGIGEACCELHELKRIHGDLKPKNIVFVGTIPKLIDLDVSCKVGNMYGKKDPSTGYASPEVAIQIEGNKLQAFKAKIAHDVFSFGAVFFLVETGQELWLTDRDGNIVKEESQKLLDWDKARLNGKLRGFQQISNEAKDLLDKLLDPNPERRCNHFKDMDGMGDGHEMMRNILKHPYFCNDSKISDKINEILDQNKKTHDFLTNLTTKVEKITTLTGVHNVEMKSMRNDLMRAIYDTTEVSVPTTFIIVEKEIPVFNEEEIKWLKQIHLKDDGTGFDGKIPDMIRNGRDILKDFNIIIEQASTWIDYLTDPDNEQSSDDDNDQEAFFGVIKKRLEKIVTGKTMYIYLVDELTGMPVTMKIDGVYPYTITQPSEFVKNTLPYIQGGMRAMSLYNGTAGVAQMFGCPLPRIPKKLHENLKSSVDILKQRSSVENYDVLQSKLDNSDFGGNADSVRGAPLREFTRFLKKHDENKVYAGLRRIAGDDGGAIWTTIENETEVKTRLQERAELRKKEEHSDHKKLLNQKRLEKKEKKKKEQSRHCKCAVM